MQTPNCTISGLHNCLEVSEHPLCLDKAMWTWRKCSITEILCTKQRKLTICYTGGIELQYGHNLGDLYLCFHLIVESNQ